MNYSIRAYIMTLINVLTRTGRRPGYYKTLKDSLEAQTHPHIRHIKSNDNPECAYLTDETDVFAVQRNPHLGRGFYNVYLNELGKQVTDGWIIVLDDDSKLINPAFLDRLALACSEASETQVLIYKSRIGGPKGARDLPNPTDFRNKNIRATGIDMACFCFHHSLLKDIQFDARIWGDFHFLDKVRKNHKYSFKFVQLPVGIWANYDGQKLGK